MDLEVGIPMGSPILFVLAMEVITKAAERSGHGIAFSEGEELPPIRSDEHTDQAWGADGFTPLNASHRLPVQNNDSSNAIISAIKQLVVSGLYHFEDLDHTFSTNMKKKIKKKNIWWRLFFRDTEPWRDACFKRVLAYLEIFLEIGNTRVPKSLINSTKNGTEKNFALSFKFYVQTLFFSTFITLHLGKGHIQTINRHSGPDGVC